MTDHRIVYYDEIEDLLQVTLLFQLSLNFTALPTQLKELRTSDERYTREFGIFALAEDGTVAAGHLLMRIPTATTEGRLDVGGVNAVATRPEFGRRGLMTKIMEATHNYFQQQKLEYSFLTTSRRLGAMMLYERFEYAELRRSTCAVKYPNRTRTNASPEITVRPFHEGDVPSVGKVYNNVVRGSYGFIYRSSNFLKARQYDPEIKVNEGLRIAETAGEVTGYAYWDSKPQNSECYEIMAVNRPSFHTLLSDAEHRNPDGGILVWCDGLTNREVEWLSSAGYQAPIQTYGSTLIKSLKERTDSRKLREIYGVNTGQFRLGLWDSI